MLEQVDLTKKLSKSDYKTLLPRMQKRLYDLQKACWDEKVPSMIVFEGWDAAGKGSTVAILTSRLDPRGYQLHPIQAPRSSAKRRPWLWRFWTKIPAYGQMAIFDRSWYGRVLVERVEELTPEKQWREGYQDIVEFEQMLADDGMLIIKFWLHISKDEQRERFEKLEKNPLTSWQVDPEDWEHHNKYEEYLLAAEEMLERTETEWGPWTIVEATNKRHTHWKVFDTIINRLEARLGDAAPPVVELTDLDFDEDDEVDNYVRQMMSAAEKRAGKAAKKKAAGA